MYMLDQIKTVLPILVTLFVLAVITGIVSTFLSNPWVYGWGWIDAGLYLLGIVYVSIFYIIEWRSSEPPGDNANLGSDFKSEPIEIRTTNFAKIIKMSFKIFYLLILVFWSLIGLYLYPAYGFGVGEIMALILSIIQMGACVALLVLL